MELKELPMNGLLTSVYGFDSKYRNMKYGVPQGSLLGPLLFLIYINNLYNAIIASTVYHFADDTNLLVSNVSNQYKIKFIWI